MNETMDYLNSIERGVSQISRQNDEHANYFAEQFSKSQEANTRMFNMLSELTKQMQISNTLSAIRLSQEYEAEGKPLPEAYQSLVQNLVSNASNVLPQTKNTEGRGHEFDDEFHGSAQALPDYVIQ